MPRGRSTKRRAAKPTAYSPLTDDKWASMVPFGTFVSEFDIYEAH